MLIATFNSDAWQVAYESWEPRSPGGDLLPVVKVSPEGEPFPIAVPESLLDQEVLEGQLGAMLVDTWRLIRRTFCSISDEVSGRFVDALPHWLNYAGGGLYAFGNDAGNAARGRIYVGLYAQYEETKPNRADRSGYDFWLCFVVDGVAATDGPFGDGLPHNAFYAMYRHWLRSWGHRMAACGG